MSNPLKREDLIEDGALEGIISDLTKLSNTAKEFIDLIKGDLADGFKQLQKTKITDSKSLKEAVKLMTDLEQKSKIYNKVLKEEEATQKKLKKAKEEQIKTTQKETKATKDLNAEQIKEAKLREANAKATTAEAKAQEQQIKNTIIQEKELERLIAQEEKLKKSRTDEQILSDENAGSLEKVAAENRILTKERKKLNLETEAGRKRLQEINNIIDRNTDYIRENSDALTKLRLNVGNYKESIQEAFEGTGIFDGVLGKLSKDLGKVKDELKKASEEGAGFGSKLKILGGGLALAGIALLGKAITDFIEISQKAQDEAFRLKQALNFAVTQKSVNDYISTLEKTRPTLLKIAKDLQSIANEEGDLNAIVNDQTVSLTIRNDALNKASELAVKRTELEKQRAGAELENVRAEVAMAASKIGEENILFELKKKLIDAENAYSKAISDNESVIVDNKRRQRQLTQETIIGDVEILNSKKLTANVQTKLLEKQIADEKRQIEQRENDVKKLDELTKKTVNEEFKILQKGISEQIKQEELLAIQDEILLKQYIRRNLASIEGTALEVQLLKVIKQSQEAQIKTEQEIAKLEEEKIQRKIKISEIEKQIALDNKEFEINILSKQIEEEKELNEELRNDIYKDDNVFNSKKLKAYKKSLEDVDDLNQKQYQKQLEQLDIQRQQELENATNTINDFEIRKKEFERINQYYNNRQSEIRQEENKAEIDAEKKKQEELRLIREQQIKIIAKEANQVLGYITDAYSKASEKRQQQFDAELKLREQNLEEQRALAEKGANNEYAAQKAILAQTELEKRKAAERDAKIQKWLGFLKTYNSFVEQDPNTAIQKTLAQIAGVTVAEQLFLAEGQENIKGPGTKTSDSIPAMLSKGESVLTADATERTKGFVTAANAGKEMEWFKNNLFPKMLLQDNMRPLGTLTDNQLSSVLMAQNNGLQEEIKTLQQIIKNKKESNFNFNKFGEFVEEHVENGIKKRVIHKRKNVFLG